MLAAGANMTLHLLACSCLLWVPIDVIKERMQIQRAGAAGGAGGAGMGVYYRGPVHAVTEVMKHEGIVGLYRVRTRAHCARTQRIALPSAAEVASALTAASTAATNAGVRRHPHVLWAFLCPILYVLRKGAQQLSVVQAAR